MYKLQFTIGLETESLAPMILKPINKFSNFEEFVQILGTHENQCYCHEKNPESCTL